MNLYRRLLPYGVAIGSTAIAALLSLWLEEIITGASSDWGSTKDSTARSKA